MREISFIVSLSLLLSPLLIHIIVGMLVTIQIGYREDDVFSFFIRIFNLLLRLFGRMPIWIVPPHLDSYYDIKKLYNALRLNDEIRNLLKRLNWTREYKKNTLQRVYTIFDNAIKALWKLWVLHKTIEVIGYFGNDRKVLQELGTLSDQIEAEIDNAFEVLTPLSAYLAKMAVTGTSVPPEINSILKQIEVSSQKLVEAVQSDGQKFTRGNPYPSVWSYVIIFVIVVTTFSISSMYVPNYAFAVTVAGSLLGFLAIGIIQLRNNEKINESSFTQIMIEFLKSMRLIK
jgi:hypothetical protein